MKPPHIKHALQPDKKSGEVYKFSQDIKTIQLKNLSRCIERLIDSEIAMSWRSTYHPQQIKEIQIDNARNIKNLNLALHSLQKILTP